VIFQCAFVAVPFERSCYTLPVLQESKSGDRCFAFKSEKSDLRLASEGEESPNTEGQRAR